jgi:hypothetical protein
MRQERRHGNRPRRRPLPQARVADVDDTVGRTDTPVPEERYGLAFVFRVFNRVSYALVVESSKAVIVGDSARNP